MSDLVTRLADKHGAATYYDPHNYREESEKAARFWLAAIAEEIDTHPGDFAGRPGFRAGSEDIARWLRSQIQATPDSEVPE